MISQQRFGPPEMSCSTLLKTHHYSLQGRPTPNQKHIRSVCTAYSGVQIVFQQQGKHCRHRQTNVWPEFLLKFQFFKTNWRTFFTATSAGFQLAVAKPDCQLLFTHQYAIGLFWIITRNVIKNSRCLRKKIKRQRRLFWPYQVVRLRCFKGAQRYCVSLWVFQLCTPGQIYRLPNSPQPLLQAAGLRLALKMKRTNIPTTRGM